MALSRQLIHEFFKLWIKFVGAPPHIAILSPAQDNPLAPGWIRSHIQNRFTAALKGRDQTVFTRVGTTKKHACFGVTAYNLTITENTLRIIREPDTGWEDIVDEVRDALRDFFL